MRAPVTREKLEELERAIAARAPRRGAHRVYFVGGATAVAEGWRDSTIDVDLVTDDEGTLPRVQELKDQVGINIEFVRPEDFVPPLARAEGRHRFIRTIGTVSFFHYDPYSQLFSKVVRGFPRDLADARSMLSSGLVEVETLRELVAAIPDAAYERYPALDRRSVEGAVDAFLRERQY